MNAARRTANGERPTSTSPRFIWCPIHSIPRCVAVDVVDARLAPAGGVGGGGGLVERRAAGVGRVGCGGDLLPIGLHGDGILGNVAQVLRRLQLVEVLRVLLFVGVVVVDGLAHFEQVVAQ